MPNYDSFKSAAEERLHYFYISNDIIVHSSDRFKKRFNCEGQKYTDVFPGLIPTKENQILIVNDIPCLFTIRNVIVNDEKYTLVYLNKDIGEIAQNTGICIGIIQIDNYDLISSTLSAEQLSLQSAIIHNKLALLANNYKFVVLNATKESYTILLNSITLSMLKEDQFSFVKEIKQTDLGIDIPLTISIGIAESFPTLAETFETAKKAVDFAVSRGGDQVAIKDPNKYTFFGGDEETATNFNKMRSRIKAQLLSELYANAKNILIMGHKNPDYDSLGSALGLNYLANCLNVPCNIILEEHNRSSERIIEMMKDDTLKDVFINKDTALKKCNRNTLLIVVDVHKPSLTEFPELLESKKTKKIALFDHHRRGIDYIKNPILTYHEASASSTSELITDMLVTLKEVNKLPPNAADALLAGITLDTKWFTFKVTPRTFECAAQLQKFGANTVNIHKLLQNNFEEYQLKYNVISGAEIYYNKIAIATQLEQIENQSIIVSQASDELLTFSGIEVSFVISQYEDYIHISARSQGEINVQVIMEHFDGGGHKTMAACRITNSTIDEVKNQLLEYIKEKHSKYLV